MKNEIILCLALFAGSALHGVSVVTQADTKTEYGDETFYFYVVNNTQEDISFCRKNSNPLIYKSDVLLKITEDDLEVENRGEKYTSMAWIETSGRNKIKTAEKNKVKNSGRNKIKTAGKNKVKALGNNKIEICELHGAFYMKFENQEELLELFIKHIYKINVDDENHVKIKDITI